MAKKQKRSVSKTTSTSVEETTQKTSFNSRLSSSDFNPDYSDVIYDLKRIGILAGSFFAVLIALAFFLR